MKKIAIIGAGISGLSIAKLLEKNADITLFEKSRGVSGRLSTRRIDSYVFDHGAQYFTARTDEFKKFLDPLFKVNVVEKWTPRYMKFNLLSTKTSELIEDQEVRYVGTPNMNSICKYLAEGLNVKLNTRIISIKKDDKWSLTDENENEYHYFDWVISTAPSPQTTALFSKEFIHYDHIKSIDMIGAFALMLGFQNPIKHKFDAAHILNSDISWISFNNTKPKRFLDNTSIVIHSSHEFFDKNLHTETDVIISNLLREASYVIGHDLSCADCKLLHPWRYANITTEDKMHSLIDTDLFIAASGDWSAGGRVEGAFVSAYRVANRIKELL